MVRFVCGNEKMHGFHRIGMALHSDDTYVRCNKVGLDFEGLDFIGNKLYTALLLYPTMLNKYIYGGLL